jgi:Right handed beta helix region
VPVNRRLPIALAGLVLGASCLARPPVILHVSLAGDDRWSGFPAAPNPSETDGPLASLAGARDAVRRLPRPRPPVVVDIAEGTYPVSAPIVFDSSDGGGADAPVVYRAAPGATPVFDGGVEVRGWQRRGDGLWAAPVPFATTGLWRAGLRLPIARIPWSGLALATGVSESAWRNSPSRPAGNGRPWYQQSGIVVTTDNREVAEALPALRGGGCSAARIVVYHIWDVTRRPLDSVDPAARSLSVHGRGINPQNPWAPGKSRFFLENAPAALGPPGTWSLAPGSLLEYRPAPGETGEPAGIVAPRVARLLVLRGEPGRPVAHLSFVGLGFRHAGWIMPASGVEPCQAAADAPAAIEADGACDVSFEGCVVEHTSAYALWFRRGCRDVTVRRCRLEDLGAGGVRIGEKEIARVADDRTGRITVDDCIIRGGGRQFESAVGVWIGQSADNVIVHNDISDLYYSGISAGWTWGYGPSAAARNRIAYNRIHGIGLGLLSDMGGIYLIGRAPGTVCEHNVVEDVTTAEYGGCGIYLDEGSTGVVVRDNLVCRAQTDGLHVHYGEANLVENNIFVGGSLVKKGLTNQVRVTRAEPHLTLTFRRNIVVWTKGVLTRRDAKWAVARIARDHNLYFRPGAQSVDFAGMTLREWEASGRESGSVVADPRFVDPEAGDYRVRPDSPAIALGFVPFDPREAGVYGDPAWIAKAARR